MSERKERRILIAGTAPTYRLINWDDPSMEYWLLNDMHVLNPPRADRWFDCHPLDKMYFRDPAKKKVFSGDVPAGHFVRPAGHLEWLKRQTIPVYMAEAPQGWPHAVTFPREAIEKKFGLPCASSPAWMIALALMEGVTELHIYGIHLATEWEYMKQKPNMLLWIGLAMGMGVRVVIPKGCPLLAETHQYAFEEDPDVPNVALKRKVERLQAEKQALKAREKGRKWYQRRDPNFHSRLAFLTAQITDAQLGMQHVTAGHAPAGM